MLQFFDCKQFDIKMNNPMVLKFISLKETYTQLEQMQFFYSQINITQFHDSF